MKSFLCFVSLWLDYFPVVGIEPGSEHNALEVVLQLHLRTEIGYIVSYQKTYLWPSIDTFCLLAVML